MTIAVRNRIVLGGMALIVLFLATFLLSIALLFGSASTPEIEVEDRASIAPLVLSILSELLFCAAAVTMLYFSFKKTASAEIFLFMLFLISMSFDSLKTIHLLFEAMILPRYFITMVTRIIYFGRFFGILCLFSSGLFSTGIAYERLEIILLAGLLISFVLGATLPIDTADLKSHFVMVSIYEREMTIVTAALYLFAFANYLLAAYQSGKRSYLFISLGIALVVVGRELLYYRLDGVSVGVAFVLLVAGSTLVGEQMHEVHLWA